MLKDQSNEATTGQMTSETTIEAFSQLQEVKEEIASSHLFWDA